MRLVRETLELKQSEFADLLNAAAGKLGMESNYTALSVSQRETGRRALEVEDYAIVSYVDPQRRSWFWLAFGRELPKAMLIPREGKGSQRGTGT